jgi:PPM family protein phosphatase
MERRFWGLTDTGLVRSVNQDSYYIDDPKGRFFIVADGMGGHAGGQEASQIATKQIQSYLEENWESDQSSQFLLQEAIDLANQSILEDQNAHPERADMGTTVVILMFRERVCCAHIGDSRLYRLRESKLSQITEDHTWVGLALRSGEINKEQAKVHPWRHVLSQCLGRKELLGVDFQEIDIQPGDRFVLCSDGLTEEVADDLIDTFLSESETCEEAAIELVEAAKKAGGSDNITVIIVEQN